MSQVAICPVCNGKGKAIPEGTWAGPLESYPTCGGCSGKGWIEVICPLLLCSPEQVVSPIGFGYPGPWPMESE